MTQTITRKARKTDAEKKHEHYLNLAVLLRQGRIHRMDMIAGQHIEHTFANGEHVDFYASETYAGFAYMVVSGAQGYECGCKHFEFHKQCSHTKDASHRAAERYRSAKRQNELDGARVVAPLVLGQAFEQDLQAHLEDEMPAQDDAFERVYKVLVFGTINRLDDIMQRVGMVEPDLATNALEVLRANGRIIVRKVERGVFWVDTPDQAYRSAYYGDYAA